MLYTGKIELNTALTFYDIDLVKPIKCFWLNGTHNRAWLFNEVGRNFCYLELVKTSHLFNDTILRKTDQLQKDLIVIGRKYTVIYVNNEYNICILYDGEFALITKCNGLRECVK